MDAPSAKKCEFLLTVHDYDDDNRELYTIKEVNEYLSKAFDYRPGTLSRMTMETARLFLVNESMVMITDSNSVNTKIALNKDKIRQFSKKVMDNIDDIEDLQAFNAKYKKILNV